MAEQTTSTIDSKLDKFVERIGDSFEKWLTEFEQHPMRTAVKVVVILWLVRAAYDLWKDTLPRAVRR